MDILVKFIKDAYGHKRGTKVFLGPRIVRDLEAQQAVVRVRSENKTKPIMSQSVTKGK